MKRLFAFALVLCLLFSMIGCRHKRDEAARIAFYYCVVQPAYSTGSTAISAEYRGGIEDVPLAQTLGLYLDGPLSADLRSPFPHGLRLLEAKLSGSTVHLTVSQELAELTGLELTMACGCLALTTMALTEAQQVEISAEAGLLDGQRSIIIDQNSLLLLDTVEGE